MSHVKDGVHPDSWGRHLRRGAKTTYHRKVRKQKVDWQTHKEECSGCALCEP